MLTTDLKNQILFDVAKAADLCIKPFVHSVSLENQIDNEKSDEIIEDLIFKIHRRNIEGESQPSMDIDLEVYKSGSEINMTLSWASILDSPILWQGKHSVWMNSETGLQCQAPSDGQLFETLARRLRTIFKGSLV